MNKRIYVEKKEGFQVEANSLLNDFNSNLGLKMKSLRIINVYDVFDIEEELLEKAKKSVFAEIVTDNVYDELDLEDTKYLAVEYLPGQFDQRASSAMACLSLIDPNTKAHVKSGRILIFEDGTKDETIEKITHYFVNRVESRVKDLSILKEMTRGEVKEVRLLTELRSLKDEELESYCENFSLAMNKDDLKVVREYFKKENRDPYETELRILDTYWSDHCRHTTFSTYLEEITIDDGYLSEEMKDSYDLYLKMRKELRKEDKPICLMDMATIGARYLRKKGYLDDLEVSDENNACSIFINVKVNKRDEKWLLMFKNETHNHPTEIEPFGGASTCLGGAIRDPLSGRSYVYQAMRVTGSGDIYQPYEKTLKGKLPQSVISTKAAAGYSSYGNQIGLATTHVKEIYHDGYVAKRLEVGAVVGAVKAENVIRETPMPGDVILLLGGRTGRDGIGGATGSSKKHNIHSIDTCSSEVQKGNAPEERKIEHLFRRKEVCKLIKKSNDFGAGGVSVAIGELASGLDIYLDKVKTKYNGLNATELAISESQERMAVVIDKKNEKLFKKYCREENIEVTHVADVTDTKRMRMFYKGVTYCDLERAFIDSQGAKHVSDCRVVAREEKDVFHREVKDLRKDALQLLKDKNVASQKGLVEMFDSTIGRSTVLLPYGGLYQLSETQVSAQKLPVGNDTTTTCSVMAYGYDPYVSEISPFLGSQYAVIDAISKAVASGCSYQKMRFSYQEYFEKMTSKETFGKPFASLLGAIKIQNDFKLPSIGGKDSMSGTFDDIHVPEMLMAFGITTCDVNDIISTDFKKGGHHLYLVKHHCLDHQMPNIDELKNNFDFVTENIHKKNIVSAFALGFGGLFEALVKCSLGNQIGFIVNYDENKILDKDYGSILIESKCLLDNPSLIYLGKTSKGKFRVNSTSFRYKSLVEANFDGYSKVYPIRTDKTNVPYTKTVNKPIIEYPFETKKPVVYIPVFPGTNCDYDSMKAFVKAGAKVKTSVFRNLNSSDVLSSINQMKRMIDKADIFMIAGGFSSADEPDGSGKFIANILTNETIKEAIENLLKRKGLILGICNGFQALVKCGLLPYGKFDCLTKDSPTLFRNDINRHISHITTTKVINNSSPWLKNFKVNDVYAVAQSHGEGKFTCSESVAKELFDKGMVAFQYCSPSGDIATDSTYNINGSTFAIEGVISEDGLILGKMGHAERFEKNNFKNIYGNKDENIFKNAVDYFLKK